MNNEPVAWINTRISDERPFLDWEKTEEQNYLSVPLYTHPAKTLTPLTDDEIEIECRKAWNLNDQYRLNLEEVIRFAHAIRKKGTRMNANELNGIEVCNDKQIAEMDVNHLVEYLNGWYSTAAPRKAATMLRQQQEKLNKYELRNMAQCDRIAHLEAKLSEALDAENDRRFE